MMILIVVDSGADRSAHGPANTGQKRPTMTTAKRAKPTKPAPKNAKPAAKVQPKTACAAKHTAAKVVPAAAPETTTTETRAPRRREGTKQAKLIAMLSAASGATIAEIATALAWQAHTIRAALSHALAKRLGLKVTSSVDAKRGRVYRIEG